MMDKQLLINNIISDLKSDIEQLEFTVWEKNQTLTNIKTSIANMKQSIKNNNKKIKELKQTIVLLESCFSNNI